MKNLKIPGIFGSKSSGWLIFAIIIVGAISMGIINHGWWQAWEFHIIVWPTLAIILFLVGRVFWHDYKNAPRLSAIGPLLAIFIIGGSFLLGMTYGIKWLATGEPPIQIYLPTGSEIIWWWHASRLYIVRVALVILTIYILVKIWRPRKKVVTP